MIGQFHKYIIEDHNSLTVLPSIIVSYRMTSKEYPQEPIVVQFTLGNKKFPNGARNYVQRVLKEEGYDLEVGDIVYPSKYGFSVYLKGICPIHERIHSSNRFKIQQPRNEWWNCSIYCNNDGALIKLPWPLLVMHQ